MKNKLFKLNKFTYLSDYYFMYNNKNNDYIYNFNNSIIDRYNVRVINLNFFGIYLKTVFLN